MNLNTAFVLLISATSIAPLMLALTRIFNNHSSCDFVKQPENQCYSPNEDKNPWTPFLLFVLVQGISIYFAYTLSVA